MTPFVPHDFDVPKVLDNPHFRLEPLGVEHNERDDQAWMSSIDHIGATPGFAGREWPHQMTLDQNRNDLAGHANDFEARTGFTYTVLDGDEVIGCLYIYPRPGDVDPAHDVLVRSWVTEARSDLDVELWSAVSDWLATVWPFQNPAYAPRT